MSFTKAETASLGSFRIGHILFVRLLPYVSKTDIGQRLSRRESARKWIADGKSCFTITEETFSKRKCSKVDCRW